MDKAGKAGKVTRDGGHLHFQVQSTGQCIRIREDHGMVDGLGGQVWDGCFALCEYLETLPCGALRGKRVLELGCGAGLSGLLCAFLGADVVLTDEFTDLAEENARVCNAEHGLACRVAALRWGADVPLADSEALIPGSYDVILGAELTPLRGAHAALVETLVRFAQSHQTKVLLTFDGDARNAENLTAAQQAFVQRMRNAGFEDEVKHVCELAALPHYNGLLTAPVGDSTSVVQFTKSQPQTAETVAEET